MADLLMQGALLYPLALLQMEDDCDFLCQKHLFPLASPRFFVDIADDLLPPLER
jgi:hypothetical protein